MYLFKQSHFHILFAIGNVKVMTRISALKTDNC